MAFTGSKKRVRSWLLPSFFFFHLLTLQSAQMASIAYLEPDTRDEIGSVSAPSVLIMEPRTQPPPAPCQLKQYRSEIWLILGHNSPDKPHLDV